MARPPKRTVDYFPHKCHHTGTMLVLERKYGIQGSGAWWKLLETLGSTEGHYIDCNDKTKWLFLQASTYFEEDDLCEYLNMLADLKAIDYKLWTEGKIIWCQNFVNNISEVYINRKREIPPKPNLNHDVVSTPDNHSDDAVSIPDNHSDDVVSTPDNHSDDVVSTPDNQQGGIDNKIVSTTRNPTEGVVSTVENPQIKLNETKVNNNTLSKDNDDTSRNNQYNKFKKELDESINSKDKISILVRIFKTLHDDAPNEDFDHDSLYGRMGKMYKSASGNYDLLLDIIWDTVTESISGSHLSYIQGRLKWALNREKEKAVGKTIKPASSYADIEKGIRR